jgi:hypothetical protein
MGEARTWVKGVGGWVHYKQCVYVRVNGKMRPVETMPGMGVGRNKGEWWGGELKYDKFDVL